MKLARDIIDVITRPFIDNQEGFKSAIDGFLGALATALETVKGVVDNTMQTIGDVYDAHVKPMFDALAQGFSDIVGVLLTAYQQHIQPVLEDLAERLGPFAEQYIQPMIEKATGLIGKIADAVTLLWENVIKPFIEWIVNTIIPAIAPVLQAAVDTFFALGEAVSGVVSQSIEVLGGVIDFIVGVFTGEWGLAWEGIKEIFYGIWELMKEVVTGAITIIYNIINLAWTSLSNLTSVIWNGIKALLSTLWNWLKSLASSVFNGIKTAISNAWNLVKTTTSEIWNNIKLFLANLWENVKTTAETSFLNVKDTIVGIWESVKEKTGEIWNGIWDTIKGIINNIIGGVEGMVNRVVEGINTLINGANTLVGKIPGMSANIIPTISSVSLPRLAQGGFVRANTPQLAMIGDNRHHGEIVAPEDKMQAMVDRAVAMASKPDGMSEQYLSIMVELLQKIIELIENLELVVNIDIREIRQKLVDLEKRSGYSGFRKT